MAKIRRDLVLGAIAALLAALAAYRVFFARSGKPSIPARYAIEGVCLACREPASLEAKLDQHQPFTCARCGQQAVYEWMFCLDCRKRFVPDLVPSTDGPARVPAFAPCPACRRTNVTQYIPQDTTQQPVGDAPLPRWPP